MLLHAPAMADSVLAQAVSDLRAYLVERGVVVGSLSLHLELTLERFLTISGGSALKAFIATTNAFFASVASQRILQFHQLFQLVNVCVPADG